MSTHKGNREPILRARIDEARGQLSAMRAKQRRLNEAIRQREQHIIRLEATAVLGRALPSARNCHE